MEGVARVKSASISGNAVSGNRRRAMRPRTTARERNEPILIDIAQQHSELFPANFLAETRKDVRFFDSLSSIRPAANFGPRLPNPHAPLRHLFPATTRHDA